MLTRAQLLALPGVIDLDTANRALAIGRSTGYALAKRDHYPVKVLRLGNAYRVVTSDLLRLLQIDQQLSHDAPTRKEPATGHDLCA